MQAVLNTALAAVVVAVVAAVELVPTGVLPAPLRTQAPAEVVRAQYAQTLYKATDYSTVMNTLVPLWPAHSTDYQDLSTTTVINQTISTSAAEFSTVLNTTVLYYSDPVATNTWDGATTSYQTLEFQHQSVLYTDRQNKTHTDIEQNFLPLV